MQSESFALSDLLDQAASGSEQAREILDVSLLPWIKQGRENRHGELVNRAAHLIADNPISQIGEILHCSQRTIERAFLRVTGLTLKQYQSMIRLEAILEHLYGFEDTDVNWTDVAYKFGFSDQAHLIRFLKSTVGTTPGGYARDRNLTIDVYANFE